MPAKHSKSFTQLLLCFIGHQSIDFAALCQCQTRRLPALFSLLSSFLRSPDKAQFVLVLTTTSKFSLQCCINTSGSPSGLSEKEEVL